MKKIINVLLCIGCVLACTACDGKGTEQKNANTSDTTETTVWTAGNSVVEDDQTLTPAPEGWPVVDTDTIEAHSVTRNFKTDGANYFVSASQCQTENGYYALEFSGEGSAIYYFDSSSHTYSALCNRPDCKHNSSDCNTYLDECYGLEYYNGKLYTVSVETEEKDNEVRDGQVWTADTVRVKLYAFSLDGSSKQEVQCLKTVECSLDQYNIDHTFLFFIHRGYVYYVQYMAHPLRRADTYWNGQDCLYRVPLGGKETEAECVYVLPEQYGELGSLNMKPYGDYIYFVNPAEGTLDYGRLYRINLTKKQVERLPIEKNIYSDSFSFYVKEDGIYYYSEDEQKAVYEYCFTDGSEKKVVELPEKEGYTLWDVLYDDTYWYVVYGKDSGDVWASAVLDVILDGEFQKLGEIERQSAWNLPFELRDVIPILGYDDSDKIIVTGWIDKSEFAKGIFTIHEVESSE
jgi:hypothetical protein